MNVDLPVFGRPTTAIFITASAGLVGVGRREHLLDQLAASAFLLRFCWAETAIGLPRPSL